MLVFYKEGRIDYVLCNVYFDDKRGHAAEIILRVASSSDRLCWQYLYYKLFYIKVIAFLNWCLVICSSELSYK